MKRARRPFVSGVILAAGMSRRFGTRPPKQLAEIDGEPQVRRIARQALAASLDEVIVVVGHRADDVCAALAGLELRTVENSDYATGQASSVRAGLAVAHDYANAVMFLPCDQPFLDHETLDRVLGTYRAARSAIVVPAHARRRGAPVLFDRRLFSELAALGGDRGGRQLLAEYSQVTTWVQLPSALPLADFDTREELAALLAAPAARRRSGRG
jgi:molybdenum cofactor cytidylyltransferase